MNQQLPRPPQEISGDGREIWDWAAKLSEHTYRMDRMRKLSADIRVIGTRCGDCDNWMKSSQCPQERNENGRQRGPSMNGLKCIQFVETHQATARRETLKDELKTVEAEHAAAAT